MEGIIAVNNLGFIGLEGKLPWKCREDLQHFKALTLNRTLLVGYNTYSTLPTLHNRVLVVDRREVYEDDVLKYVDFCIGGRKTYERYCHLFTTLHVSYINDNTIGDVTYPSFSKLNPNCKIISYKFEPNIIC